MNLKFILMILFVGNLFSQPNRISVVKSDFQTFANLIINKNYSAAARFNPFYSEKKYVQRCNEDYGIWNIKSFNIIDYSNFVEIDKSTYLKMLCEMNLSIDYKVLLEKGAVKSESDIYAQINNNNLDDIFKDPELIYDPSSKKLSLKFKRDIYAVKQQDETFWKFAELRGKESLGDYALFGKIPNEHWTIIFFSEKEKKEVYSIDFRKIKNNNYEGWPIKDSKSKVWIDPELGYVIHSQNEPRVMLKQIDFNYGRNYEIETEIEYLSGPNKKFGNYLEFSRQNVENNFIFGFKRDSIKIGFAKGGKTFTLLDYTYLENLNKNIYSKNTSVKLKVVKYEGKMHFFVNNKLVASFDKYFEIDEFLYAMYEERMQMYNDYYAGNQKQKIKLNKPEKDYLIPYKLPNGFGKGIGFHCTVGNKIAVKYLQMKYIN